MEEIIVRDLGVIDFREAWDIQEGLLKSLVDFKRVREPGADGRPAHHLLFCEHPHVYTLGKSGKEDHLLITEEQLASKGATFHRINRGGDITYHGPGQLVVYPVLDLDRFFNDIHKYMRCLEEVVIRALADFGLEGRRVEKCTGVWVDSVKTRRPAKICAMGVRCSRWVTMHGLALNVNTSLEYFDQIIPCGIADKEVTSMQQMLGEGIAMDQVKEAVRKHFGAVFSAVLRDHAVEA